VVSAEAETQALPPLRLLSVISKNCRQALPSFEISPTSCQRPCPSSRTV
jgi:hypothetical protein